VGGSEADYSKPRFPRPYLAALSTPYPRAQNVHATDFSGMQILSVL